MSDRSKSRSDTPDHWLVRPKTIRLMWIGGIALLVASVMGDFFVKHYKVFGPEATFGFGAWYGFLSCIALVFFAKLIEFFLKRPDDYYDD